MRASDPSGAYSTATFDIAVVQAPNSAPTDITLSNTTIAEDSPVGAVVGALAAVDPDNGDSSTFTLINDAGGPLRCRAPTSFWPRRSTTKPLNPRPSRCRSPIPPATALRRT